jgi:hypothetical protein
VVAVDAVIIENLVLQQGPDAVLNAARCGDGRMSSFPARRRDRNDDRPAFDYQITEKTRKGGLAFYRDATELSAVANTTIVRTSAVGARRETTYRRSPLGPKAAFQGTDVKSALNLTGAMPRSMRLLKLAPILKRPVRAYLRENIHYAFSGFFFQPTFIALLLELGGVDRMMFSVDHPFQSMTEGHAFLEQLPVSAADKERIAHGNAEKLFKL